MKVVIQLFPLTVPLLDPVLLATTVSSNRHLWSFCAASKLVLGTGKTNGYNVISNIAIALC